MANERGVLVQVSINEGINFMSPEDKMDSISRTIYDHEMDALMQYVNATGLLDDIGGSESVMIEIKNDRKESVHDQIMKVMNAGVMSVRVTVGSELPRTADIYFEINPQ